MDDGEKSNYGLRISTQSFSENEVKILSNILLNKFNLKTSLPKQNNIPNIYFPKSSMPLLAKIIKPYMIPSMYYKLNGF
jgi:hypothetical protein